MCGGEETALSLWILTVPAKLESSSYGPVELVLVGSESQAEGQGHRAEVVVRPWKERDGCQHVGQFCWGTFGCTDK